MPAKKSTRKPTFVDKARAKYQEAFDLRNDPDKRAAARAAAASSKKAKPAPRQWGEPGEMSEARKSRIRAARASARKGK